MIVAITGGRYDFRKRPLAPSNFITGKYLRLLDKLSVSVLVHGDAIGTDRYIAAKTYLYRVLINIKGYPVEAQDGPWPLAGHRRNRRMLIQSGAQGLIAFPGGGGTANCVSEGMSLGIRVWEWQGGREQEQGNFIEITPSL